MPKAPSNRRSAPKPAVLDIPEKHHHLLPPIWIGSLHDALLIFQATWCGLIPRVTRRFTGAEKRTIRSGTVVVYTVEETGIQRWTDPYSWSASRVLDNFLVYREREDHTRVPSDSPQPPDESEVASTTEDEALPLDHLLERSIYGCWNAGKGFKADGLMKKSITLKIRGTSYHMVSYYRPSDILSGVLQRPKDLREMKEVVISPSVVRGTLRLRFPPHLACNSHGRLEYTPQEDGPAHQEWWAERQREIAKHGEARQARIEASPLCSGDCYSQGDVSSIQYTPTYRHNGDHLHEETLTSIHETPDWCSSAPLIPEATLSPYSPAASNYCMSNAIPEIPSYLHIASPYYDVTQASQPSLPMDPAQHSVQISYGNWPGSGFDPQSESDALPASDVAQLTATVGQSYAAYDWAAQNCGTHGYPAHRDLYSHSFSTPCSESRLSRYFTESAMDALHAVE